MKEQNAIQSALDAELKRAHTALNVERIEVTKKRWLMR
jgi:hypothetical protein